MPNILYPPHVQWEVTEKCNHNCIYCYNYWRTCDTAKDSSRLFEISRAIIKRKPFSLVLTGGEPLLLFEKLKPIIEDFLANDIRVSINTNGRLLNEEIATFFVQKGISCLISFPSIDENISDRITGVKDTAETVLKNMEMMKEKGVRFSANIVLTKLNVDTLYQTLLTLASKNISIQISPVAKPINAREEYNAIELDTNDWESIVEQCKRVYIEKGVVPSFTACIPMCAFKTEEERRLFYRSGCYAGVGSYAVDIKGDVKACARESMSYGNLLVDDFANIYAQMKDWRTEEYIPNECNGCVLYYKCRGGCRMDAYAKNGCFGKLQTFANTSRKDSISDIEFPLSNQGIVLADDTVLLLQPHTLIVDNGLYRIQNKNNYVHVSKVFYDWVNEKKSFTYKSFLSVCRMEEKTINQILCSLIRMGFLAIDKRM